MNELVPRRRIDELIDLLNEHFPQFIDARRPAETTIATYRQGLKRLTTWMRNAPLDDVSMIGVAFRNYMLDYELSPGTVNTTLAGLRSYFAFLIARSPRVNVNPFVGVRAKTERRKQREVLGGEGRARFLKACRGDRPIDLRDFALARLMLTTGLRVSSVIGIDASDLAKENDTWVLQVQHKARISKDDVVVLGERVVTAINKYLACLKGLGVEGGRMFRSHRGRGKGHVGEKLTRGNLTDAMKARFKKAGIMRAGLTAHSLRGTAITRGLQLGKSLEDMQVVAGHSSPETTAGYDERRRRLKNAPELLLDEDLEE